MLPNIEAHYLPAIIWLQSGFNLASTVPPPSGPRSEPLLVHICLPPPFWSCCLHLPFPAYLPLSTTSFPSLFLQLSFYCSFLTHHHPVYLSVWLPSLSPSFLLTLFPSTPLCFWDKAAFTVCPGFTGGLNLKVISEKERCATNWSPIK